MRPTAVCFLGLATFLAPVLAYGQSSTTIALTTGKTKTVTGKIRGSGYADYRIRVEAGESIAVAMSDRRGAPDFNVLPPKSDNVALFIGSMDGSKMPARMMPMGGDYTIRVYQMGAAKSENRVTEFEFRVTLSGRVLKYILAGTDATIPGTPYHAMGPVSCKLESDRDRKTCDAYVVRRVRPGDGTATVEFRIGNSIRRVLFLKGKVVAHDSSGTMRSVRRGEMTTISFDIPGASEEFVVPDALVYGG